MDEWSSEDPIYDRMQAVLGWLNTGTIYADLARDILTGSAGLDWYWINAETDDDKITDLKDEAFGEDLDWILDE